MSSQYQCPNCNAEILPTAQSCATCGASFVEGSAWKPITKFEAEQQPATTLNLALAVLGIAFLVATFFPIGARVLQSATGGMYGPSFKPFSPAIFILLSAIANYLPPAFVAWLLLRHFKVMDRVPCKYRGGTLFGFGVTLVVIYLVARILAALVPGGGASFALVSLSPFILVPALGLLIVAVVQLCVGYGKGTV